MSSIYSQALLAPLLIEYWMCRGQKGFHSFPGKFDLIFSIKSSQSWVKSKKTDWTTVRKTPNYACRNLVFRSFLDWHWNCLAPACVFPGRDLMCGLIQNDRDGCKEGRKPKIRPIVTVVLETDGKPSFPPSFCPSGKSVRSSRTYWAKTALLWAPPDRPPSWTWTSRDTSHTSGNAHTRDVYTKAMNILLKKWSQNWVQAASNGVRLPSVLAATALPFSKQAAVQFVSWHELVGLMSHLWRHPSQNLHKREKNNIVWIQFNEIEEQLRGDLTFKKLPEDPTRRTNQYHTAKKLFDGSFISSCCCL